jgi:hypothetical protein
MRTWLRRRVTQPVIVHLTDGQSVQGQLYRATRDSLVLVATRHLDQGIDLAGEVVIGQPRVSFVQVLGGTFWESEPDQTSSVLDLKAPA